ncbi:glutathione S-transferase family protein [Reyranella sp.]|uniref:glutathione S-transferase family protein n=1 Tax=Reyranella sp. TaxID=1929291 RepID=UPI003BAAA6ED
MATLLIVGSYLSPYVRKVLACLETKGIAYEVDHFVPFFGDDRFSRLSPLRRIPVMVDGDLVLSDSSVICQYLEDRWPTPALFPADIADRARARWLEEFADTRMGDVFIWRLFNQMAIRPAVWGEKGDRGLFDRTVREEEWII